MKALQTNLRGLIDEEHVLVRSMVTDVNEHFHSEMRARFASGMMTPLQFQRKLFRVIDSTVRSQYYPGYHMPHKRYTMYQKPTPLNEPNCPARLIVNRQTRPKLSTASWAKIAMVVGTKEVMRSVRPRKLTCTHKSTYEPVPWLRNTERTAAAIKATRDSDDAEHKTEEILFKYNDIVAVTAEALPVTATSFCAIREDVVY